MDYHPLHPIYLQPPPPPFRSSSSFNLTLKILPRNKIRDIIIVVLVLLPTLFLLQALIALRQFPQTRQTIGTELIEDSWNELREFFIFSVAVDGEGVGGDGGVDCTNKSDVRVPWLRRKLEEIPLGAAKWMTFPSSLNMFTSSMAWMGWTLSFLRDVWSFLSSVPEDLWTFFCFLRGVPFPLHD